MEERSAGVVIYRGGSKSPVFLLLNYPSGHWDFAKGKIEYGETEIQAAVRETGEETGIVDLRFVDGFKHMIEYSFQYRDIPVHKQVVFFLAETQTKDIILSDEHENYAWMDYREALDRITFENARVVLVRAMNHLAGISS